jgi:hypothetical protein
MSKEKLSKEESYNVMAKVMPSGLSIIIGREKDGQYFFKIPANFFSQLVGMKKGTEMEISPKTLLSGAGNLLQSFMTK